MIKWKMETMHLRTVFKKCHLDFTFLRHLIVHGWACYTLLCPLLLYIHSELASILSTNFKIFDVPVQF